MLPKTWPSVRKPAIGRSSPQHFEFPLDNSPNSSFSVLKCSGVIEHLWIEDEGRAFWKLDVCPSPRQEYSDILQTDQATMTRTLTYFGICKTQDCNILFSQALWRTKFGLSWSNGDFFFFFPFSRSCRFLYHKTSWHQSTNSGDLLIVNLALGKFMCPLVIWPVISAHPRLASTNIQKKRI